MGNLCKDRDELRKANLTSNLACLCKDTVFGIYSVQHVGNGNRCHPDQKQTMTSVTLSKPVIPEDVNDRAPKYTRNS